MGFKQEVHLNLDRSLYNIISMNYIYSGVDIQSNPMQYMWVCVEPNTNSTPLTVQKLEVRCR
jgi:hypothetical protein